MAPQMDSFSLRAIGSRERLEDYVADEVIQTAGGLRLHVLIACDGAGGGEAGELAARLTARTTLESLEVSDLTNVPRMMVNAVEQTNRVVYNELSGTGTSTIAMAVTDLAEGEYGRTYIASVGNSRIYLMRERELVRLNIDHTLANEYVYAGQMSRDEAQRLENAHYPTRIIGVNPEIQVDIGFYVERGNPFVNAQRAFNIGKSGMLLREGDSLLVATEGIFRTGLDSEESAITSAELLRHAMDDDAERATRNLLRYAANRQPLDNTSLALMFVPSRFRRPVVVSRLSRRQQLLLGAATTLALLLMIGSGFFFFQGFVQQQQLDGTVAAIANTRIALDFTATPTATVTATPTITPTFTPSPAPTDAFVNQVGLQFFEGGGQNPVLLNAPVTSPQITFLTIGGIGASAIEAETGRVINRATFYLEEETLVEYSNVINDPSVESIIGRTFLGTDFFVRSRDFAEGGIFFSSGPFPEADVAVQATCFSYKQIQADPEVEGDVNRLAFTCYGEGSCRYNLADGGAVEIPFYQRVLLDLNNSELIEIGEPRFEEIQRYYEIIQTLAPGSEDVTCMGETLDPDDDTILYPADVCPQRFGFEDTEGCPDEDRDGVRDSDDVCPSEPGIAELDGCAPQPTATPFSDVDNDGFNDFAEPLDCITIAEAVDDEGCPIAEVDTYGAD